MGLVIKAAELLSIPRAKMKRNVWPNLQNVRLRSMRYEQSNHAGWEFKIL